MLISGAFFGIAVLGVAGVGLPITWLIKTSRRNRKRQFKYTSKLVDNAQNVFSNIKALRAMQRQVTFSNVSSNHSRPANSLVKHQITRHALNYGRIFSLPWQLRGPFCRRRGIPGSASGALGARHRLHPNHRLHQGAAGSYNSFSKISMATSFA